jgi:hypothetical protein
VRQQLATAIPARAQAKSIAPPRVPGHPERGEPLAACASPPSPSATTGDGACRLRGFPGDPRGVDALPSWDRAHIDAWSTGANAAITYHI